MRNLIVIPLELKGRKNEMKGLLNRFKGEAYPVIKLLGREVDSGGLEFRYEGATLFDKESFTASYKGFRVCVYEDDLRLDYTKVDLRPLSRFKVRKLFKKLKRLKAREEELGVLEKSREVVNNFREKVE